MKSQIVVIILLFTGVVRAQLPNWQLIDTRQMSSFDMLDTRTGLLAINDNGYHAISRYGNNKLTDLLAFRDTITSIIIRDAGTAFFSVKGDGIYAATKSWGDLNLIYPDLNAGVLAVSGITILASLDKRLYISMDTGSHFFAAAGMNDTVVAADFFNGRILIALSAKKIFRSTDGGFSWNAVLANLKSMNSFYVDRANKFIYAGGGSGLLKSLDSGATWQKVATLFFDTLPGQVIGARDCSGTFYIGPDTYTHGQELLRSVDFGRFFQDAGPAMFSSTRLHKGVVLDRGSTFFYLDSSGLLGYIRNGVDQTIPDSVADRIQVTQDSGVTNSLCPGTPVTRFSVLVSFSECTGIFLDSMKQVAPDASIGGTFTAGFLNNVSALSIPFTFHATHSGFDTAHYRIRFHSLITGNIEEKLFEVLGFGKSGSPELSLSETELDFPQTKVDSVRLLGFLISNPGCDTLRVDSIFSTNSTIFKLQTKQYPIRLAPGKNVAVTVSFTPFLPGDYLESLEVLTNSGNRFITLRGSTNPVATVAETAKTVLIYPNPASDVLKITTASSANEPIIIFDLLGRNILEVNRTGPDYECNVHQLPAGWYTIKLGSYYERILIRH